MPSKRFSVEQIIAKLREAEKLQAEGYGTPACGRRVGNPNSPLVKVQSGPFRAPVRPANLVATPAANQVTVTAEVATAFRTVR